MKKRAGLLVALLLLAAIFPLAVTNKASAKTTYKPIIVAKLKGNTLSYHKAVNNTYIMENPQWENIVGYGKKKKIKVSKNAKFYLLNASTMKNYKVSKKKFLKNLAQYGKSKDQGVTYYSGTFCKMTIKNGKCVKLVQKYQA
ncbi:MAG: hypothetical protein J5988_10165 [Eubacterium sp.]|nr:hypothetical protein [Eubacterium sp.]